MMTFPQILVGERAARRLPGARPGRPRRAARRAGRGRRLGGRAARSAGAAGSARTRTSRGPRRRTSRSVAAARARLALAQVHEELVLEGARDAVGWRKSSIVAPPASMPGLQRLAHRVAQRLALRARELARRAQRVDPRAEQRLVGVDVADAGDLALVEQERLDRRARARAPARAGARR